MGIIDRWLEKRGFIREAPVEKSPGFMPLETAGYPDGKPDQGGIRDFDTFVRAYRQLPWLYAGVTALAIAATKPMLKIYRETKGKDGVEQAEVEGEDINKLIEMPNPDLSYRELIQITVINLALLGNKYWNLVGTREKTPISKTNKPVEIWWVKPGEIQPQPNADGTMKSYLFTGPTGQEKQLDPSEIIHFKLVNPGSYFLGLGMMEPLTKTATLEFDAMAFQKAFLNNDGTPPFVFTAPGDMGGPEGRKRFWAAWDERHKGPKKTNRAGMIWGGMDVKTLGSGIKDAQYPELRKANREEILASLGVPPSVVGLLEYANYSNMEVQQKKFWEDAVMPMLGIIADKLTLRLAPLFDERMWFDYDYSNIRVLQEDDEHRGRVIDYLIGNGIKTPNQLRREMFNESPYVGGDQYFMKMTNVAIGADVTAAQRALKRIKAAEKKDDAPKDSFWKDPERKKALWASFDKRLAAQEQAFAPLVETYLQRQADDVKAKLETYESPQHVRPAHLFDIENEAKAYITKFETRYRFAFERAGEAGYHATKGKLWIPPEERRIKDEDTFQTRPEHIAQLKAQIEQAAKFFNETTWNVVKSGVEHAIDENMTVEEMTQYLWKLLGDRAPWEARRIASTEMGRTENFGMNEGYKQNEFVQSKGWLCSMLPTSREDHVDADGQEVGIDEDFMIPPNGGEAMAYPGDPRGSAGEVINCRCSTYPVVGMV